MLLVALALGPRAIEHVTHRHFHFPKPVIHWHTARVAVTEYVVRPDYGCETYTSLTASGSKAQRGTIAVDTSVFPFGTRFIIPGYGAGVARDTGGAVSGEHLDAAVYSCHEALNWGVKYLTIRWR